MGNAHLIFLEQSLERGLFREIVPLLKPPRLAPSHNIWPTLACPRYPVKSQSPSHADVLEPRGMSSRANSARIDLPRSSGLA